MYINNKTSHLHLHNYITMFIVSVDYPRRSTIPPPSSIFQSARPPLNNPSFLPASNYRSTLFPSFPSRG